MAGVTVRWQMALGTSRTQCRKQVVSVPRSDPAQWGPGTPQTPVLTLLQQWTRSRGHQAVGPGLAPRPPGFSQSCLNQQGVDIGKFGSCGLNGTESERVLR